MHLTLEASRGALEHVGLVLGLAGARAFGADREHVAVEIVAEAISLPAVCEGAMVGLLGHTVPRSVEALVYFAR